MYEPTDWIRNTKDLTIALVDLDDISDFAGNIISPPLMIEDYDDNVYEIADFYLGLEQGRDVVKIKLRKTRCKDS